MALEIIISLVAAVCSVATIFGCLQCFFRKRSEFTFTISPVAVAVSQSSSSVLFQSSSFQKFSSAHIGNETPSAQRNTAFTVDIEDTATESVTIEPLPDIVTKKSSLHSSRPGIKCVGRESLSLSAGNRPFPRDHLTYMNEIGTGWFGQAIDSEALRIVGGSLKSQVVVKILKDDASNDEQKLFMEEIMAYRSLEHTNVLSLLGQCTEATPYLVILEHAANGNLKTYLLSHKVYLDTLIKKNALMKFALDAAAGIACLHRHDFVHCDIAARNCLVMSDLTVKIGDYGLGETLFKEDYFDSGKEMLPIRWMAPETLIQNEGTWTSQSFDKYSDIWSFGILLWEIFSMGEQPYEMYSDEAVLQGVILDHLVTPAEISPRIPHKDKLWHLMTSLWQEANQRLNIEETHQYLDQLSGEESSRVSMVLDDGSDFDTKWDHLGINDKRTYSNASEADSKIGLAGSLSSDSFPNERNHLSTSDDVFPDSERRMVFEQSRDLEISIVPKIPQIEEVPKDQMTIEDETWKKDINSPELASKVKRQEPEMTTSTPILNRENVNIIIDSPATDSTSTSTELVSEPELFDSKEIEIVKLASKKSEIEPVLSEVEVKNDLELYKSSNPSQFGFPEFLSSKLPENLDSVSDDERITEQSKIRENLESSYVPNDSEGISDVIIPCKEDSSDNVNKNENLIISEVIQSSENEIKENDKEESRTTADNILPSDNNPGENMNNQLIGTMKLGSQHLTENSDTWTSLSSSEFSLITPSESNGSLLDPEPLVSPKATDEDEPAFGQFSSDPSILESPPSPPYNPQNLAIDLMDVPTESANDDLLVPSSDYNFNNSIPLGDDTPSAVKAAEDGNTDLISALDNSKELFSINETTPATTNGDLDLLDSFSTIPSLPPNLGNDVLLNAPTDTLHADLLLPLSEATPSKEKRDVDAGNELFSSIEFLEGTASDFPSQLVEIQESSAATDKVGTLSKCDAAEDGHCHGTSVKSCSPSESTTSLENLDSSSFLKIQSSNGDVGISAEELSKMFLESSNFKLSPTREHGPALYRSGHIDLREPGGDSVSVESELNDFMDSFSAFQKRPIAPSASPVDSDGEECSEASSNSSSSKEYSCVSPLDTGQPPPKVSSDNDQDKENFDPDSPSKVSLLSDSDLSEEDLRIISELYLSKGLKSPRVFETPTLETIPENQTLHFTSNIHKNPSLSDSSSVEVKYEDLFGSDSYEWDDFYGDPLMSDMNEPDSHVQYTHLSNPNLSNWSLSFSSDSDPSFSSVQSSLTTKSAASTTVCSFSEKKDLDEQSIHCLSDSEFSVPKSSGYSKSSVVTGALAMPHKLSTFTNISALSSDKNDSFYSLSEDYEVLLGSPLDGSGSPRALSIEDDKKSFSSASSPSPSFPSSPSLALPTGHVILEGHLDGFGSEPVSTLNTQDSTETNQTMDSSFDFLGLNVTPSLISSVNESESASAGNNMDSSCPDAAMASKDETPSLI